MPLSSVCHERIKACLVLSESWTRSRRLYLFHPPSLIHAIPRDDLSVGIAFARTIRTSHTYRSTTITGRRWGVPLLTMGYGGTDEAASRREGGYTSSIDLSDDDLGIIPKGALDPVYERKARLLNAAVCGSPVLDFCSIGHSLLCS